MLKRTDHLWGRTEADRDRLPAPADGRAERLPASVYEVVRSGRLNSRGFHPFYTAADRKAAVEKMGLLGIRDLAKQCFRGLSGGQKQRVLLARALCATKSLLLLDEPVTGLDPIVTGEFYQLIRRINRESGIAVVMVSHDIESAVKTPATSCICRRRRSSSGQRRNIREARWAEDFWEVRTDGYDH